MLIIESEIKTYAFLSIASVVFSEEDATIRVQSEGGCNVFRVPVEGATKGETIVGIFVGKDGRTEIPHIPEGSRPRRGKLSKKEYEELEMGFEERVWDLYRGLPATIARGFGC